MPPARRATAALAVLIVVDVLFTLVAIGLYEYRRGIVAHDGSALGELLGGILPLRELFPLLTVLLGLASVAAVLAVVLAGLVTPPRVWKFGAAIGVCLTVAAVGIYRVVDARHALFDTRTVQFWIETLMFAAGVVVVLSARAGIKDIRQLADSAAT